MPQIDAHCVWILACKKKKKEKKTDVVMRAGRKLYKACLRFKVYIEIKSTNNHIMFSFFF